MNLMKVFESFPVINLGKYELRELRVTDAHDFLAYMRDEKVYEFIGDYYVPKNIIEAEAEIKYWADLFRSTRSIFWGIALKSNDSLIGSCGFNLWNHLDRRVEISYDLSRKFWNQGIMTKAIKAISDYAFCNMEVNRVQATVCIENISSIKLLEKIGFKREGLLREFAVLRGKTHDSYMYSYLSKEAFQF